MRRPGISPASLAALLGAALLLAPRPAAAHPEGEQHVPCEGGRAGDYGCHEVDLLAHLPLGEIGGGSGADIWGWTDPKTGNEYALMARSNGVAFVDVSDPEAPVYVGDLPTHTTASGWRDVKVYGQFALVVSEAAGHGLQVFNMARLRRVASPPVTFDGYFHYDGFGNAHNVAVDGESGYAFAVGSDTCDGGLHMVDVRQAKRPTFAGCFGGDGYVHDVQCVTYRGPDPTFAGRELCFGSNEDTVTVVDVTDKAAPEMLARVSYAGVGYTHQGWLTEDHRYFLVDDEADELQNGHNARTYVWDVSSPRSPVLVGSYTSPVDSIDHNLFVRGDHVYQANYSAGLRVLHLDDPARARLTEVAFFDIRPEDDLPANHPEHEEGGAKEFLGAWSVYPYFASDTLVVSGIESGLFVLRPTFDGAPGEPDCPLPLGHPRYCRQCGPCAEGEGGCKRDRHCQEGLTCVEDVGRDFGFRPKLDVCLPP